MKAKQFEHLYKLLVLSVFFTSCKEHVKYNATINEREEEIKFVDSSFKEKLYDFIHRYDSIHRDKSSPFILVYLGLYSFDDELKN